ncbi:MAG: hypothetical protein U0797_19255 [Gemmataceae bacterium]
MRTRAAAARSCNWASRTGRWPTSTSVGAGPERPRRAGQPGRRVRPAGDYDAAGRLRGGTCGRPCRHPGLHEPGNPISSRGEFDRALADLDVAVRLEPDSARTRNLRGSVHAERGSREKAVADFSERLDPGYAPAWYNRGLAWAEEVSASPRPSGTSPRRFG